jgi:hypothetical protein
MLLVDSTYQKFHHAAAGVSLVAGLSRLVKTVDRFFHPPGALRKPGWAHCTDRTWRRHSAYLISRNQMSRTEYRDG